MHAYRSHTCADLRKENVGETARLAGWVHRVRDHGGVLFIDLRDHYGMTQVLCDPDSPVFKDAEKVRAEWCIRIDGEVKVIEFSGIVRRYDITRTNTVQSELVADARVTYTGSGPLTRATNRTGLAAWLYNAIDWLWRSGRRARRIDTLVRDTVAQGPVDLTRLAELQRDVRDPAAEALVRDALALVTDEDGRFQHGPQPGRWDLSVVAPGVGSLLRRNMMIDGANSDDLTFNLRKPGTLTVVMQQGKEVEASVARLAQKARAAGMHVILAT